MKNELLEKVAEFVKTSTTEIKALKSKIQEQQEGSDEKKENLTKALKKAAKSLYDADFLMDSDEQKSFIKKASEDPSYLASVLVKVCNAADVSLIGKPARVAVNKQSEYDPVMAKAFGYQTQNVLDM